MVAGLVFGLLCALQKPMFAAELPDLETNPTTQLIEAVDLSADDDSRVRHIEDSGQSGDRIETLVSGAPAVSCKIAIKPNGDSWAVWHDAATGEIRYSVRNPVQRVWAPERRLSGEGESGANPRIVHTDSATVIAFEVVEEPLSSITVSIISDVPEPIPLRTTLGLTTFAGDRDIDLRSEQGHVWVSWITSESAVEWSEYDAATGRWSLAAQVPLDGATVRQVRDAIRTGILAN